MHTKLVSLQLLKERLQSGLADAAELRRALGDAHQRARADRAAAAASFAGASVPDAVPSELVDGLDVWREKLEDTVRLHRYSSAAVGLERWREACEQYLAAERRVIASAAALTDRKNELEGRLSAREAQLSALAARGVAHDPSLDALARKAHAEIARRPLVLDTVAHAVEAFERGVVEAAKRAR
jgi:hypothetical protein